MNLYGNKIKLRALKTIEEKCMEKMLYLQL